MTLQHTNSVTCRGVRPSHPPHLVRRNRQTMSPDDVPIEQPLQNALHVPPGRAEIPEYRDVAEFRPFLEARHEYFRAREPLGESMCECTHHVDLRGVPSHVQQGFFEPSSSRFPIPRRRPRRSWMTELSKLKGSRLTGATTRTSLRTSLSAQQTLNARILVQHAFDRRTPRRNRQGTEPRLWKSRQAPLIQRHFAPEKQVQDAPRPALSSLN